MRLGQLLIGFRAHIFRVSYDTPIRLEVGDPLAYEYKLL